MNTSEREQTKTLDVPATERRDYVQPTVVSADGPKIALLGSATCGPTGTGPMQDQGQECQQT